MEVGIDLVIVDTLKARISKDPSYISKLLSEDEVKEWNVEKFAGKIAAKEALIKTGLIKAGEWHKVQIKSLPSGKPAVFDEMGRKLKGVKISISHAGAYAVSIALLE